MSGELIMLQLNITMDSTSNNNALANELANMLPGTFRGLRARIRCMDHIVNTAARRAMLMLDASPKELAHALDEATDDLERMGDDITDLGDAPAHDDDGDGGLEEPAGNNLGVELGDAFEAMNEEWKEDLRLQLEPVRVSISKVCTLFQADECVLTNCFLAS